MKTLLAIALLCAVSLHAQEVPSADRITNSLDYAQNIITGLLAILSAVLTIVAKIKAEKASTVDVLIQAIENFDNKVLKRIIKSEATEAGVEPALNKAVKSVTKKKP